MSRRKKKLKGQMRIFLTSQGQEEGLKYGPMACVPFPLSSKPQLCPALQASCTGMGGGELWGDASPWPIHPSPQGEGHSRSNTRVEPLDMGPGQAA